MEEADAHQEPPCGIVFMGTIRQMAGLTSGSSSFFRQIAAFLNKIAPAMLGAGPHFPLGVVVAHMTGLASLGVLRFLQRKCMPGMTFIAGIVLVTIPFSPD